MGSQNLALLLDIAAPEPGLNSGPVRRAALRLLLHSACRSGFRDVRWAFKLFDSATAARGRASRGRAFGELRLELLQELEEAVSQGSGPGSGPGRGRAAAAAAATQTALIEALSDYPWDRPDLTSPAKWRRGSVAEEPQPRPRNVLYLFARCPLSQADLCGFLQPSGPDCGLQLVERIVPPAARLLLSAHDIALHWVDTQSLQQFVGAPDHIGYKLISEAMRMVGGSVIPFAALMELSLKNSNFPLEKTLLGSEVDQKNEMYASKCVEQLKMIDALFPFDCSMNYLLSVDSFYRNTFPLQRGLLTIAHGEQKVCCPITLEPISCSWKYMTDSVNIIVKQVMKNWDPKRSDLLPACSWVLQQAEQKENKNNCFLQRLLQEMACHQLHMVADIVVNDSLPPCTGILSPLLCSTAMFTLIWEQSQEFEKLLSQAGITERSQEMSSELPDIVNKALNLVSDAPEECLTCSDVILPDWVHVELSETSQQNISFVEGWFPLSELSGSTSTLLESLRSIQAMDGEENMDSELALTCQLAEFYQSKSAGEAGRTREHGGKRKLCGPRTPIRQKMKSMSRSLQMLNVARLNVKAQKFQSDGVPRPTGEKSTNPSKKHLGERQKNKRARKSVADFKSSEEMVSSLKESYQKCVAKEELPQFNFIRNAIIVIERYLESGNTEELEVTCINLIQTQLLKSSKSIRQQYGNLEDREFKVKDCQLQVLLRLEMCQHFPSLQNDNEQLQQLVEEMTNLLRIISITKDTMFLAKFLEEEILNIYLFTVPKIVGELYFGLGQNVPARLASELPANFFSDECMSQEPESPGDSQPASLAPSSSCADLEEQLEELRTISCWKRRNLSLTRHRSMSEVAHNLRQIQMPKKSLKLEDVQSCLSLVTEQRELLQSSSQKKEQEVAKVRRSLFNRELLSPRKKSKMLRSQSVSLDERLGQQHGEEKTDKSNRKLLTKNVTETPLHKQVSSRLLQKQIKGRCSKSNSDVNIVEESPEKALSANSCLRRSPCIRNTSLARSHSASFYSGSRPMSRSLERVQSLSQKVKGTGNQAIQSPNRGLFSGVDGHLTPKDKSICSPSENLLDLKSCPKKMLSSPDKSRAAQRSPPAPHYLKPRKGVKNAKSPCRNLKVSKNINKLSSLCKTTTDSQVQSPRRSERLIKKMDAKGNTPLKMGSQSLLKSPSTSDVWMKLMSPKVHSPVGQPSKQNECLISPCKNPLTANFTSQLTPPGKNVSMLYSSEMESRRSSSFCLIDTSSRGELSKLCTPGKQKLRKSKSDELLNFYFVSPEKLNTSESSKRTEEIHLDLNLPVKSSSLQSNPNTPSTPENVNATSQQTQFKSPVMTRSMCSLQAPTLLTESPGEIRVGFLVTPSKSQLKTPSKSVIPLKTRSVFNRTPTKSLSWPPPRYCTVSAKDPGRMESGFNVTPSKVTVVEDSKCKSLRTRTRARFASVFSEVDHWTLTPDKSLIETLSPSLRCGDAESDEVEKQLGFCIAESERDVCDLSEDRAVLDQSSKSVSETEKIVSMKIPVKPATLLPKLDQVFETIEKSTIFKSHSKSTKIPEALEKSKSSTLKSMKQASLNTKESCATNQMASVIWAEITNDSIQNFREDCFNNVAMLDSAHSVSCHSQNTSSELVSSVGLISEKTSLSLASRTDSPTANLQTKENDGPSKFCLLPKEDSSLRLKFAVQKSRTDSNVNFVDPTKCPWLEKQTMPYEFRWTPDRRQRLIAAQQPQLLEVPREMSTPKVNKWPSRPTYEVELEMQDSGLPKLRFKRTNSSIVIRSKLDESAAESNNTPLSVCLKKHGCESPLGEAHPQGCVKHSGGGHISPSLCFHPSLSTPADVTPRKGGVQTYICQSYTPTQCSSSTSSPSQTDLGAIPWTPSPTHNLRPSQTPDAIKNWPRKKKADTTPLGRKRQKVGEPMQNDGNFFTEHNSSKTRPDELSMEGVSRLQDQSPNVEWDQRFPDSPTIFTLHSRKRGSSFISPVASEGREVKKCKETIFTGTSSDSGLTVGEFHKKVSSPSSSVHRTILHTSFEEEIFSCRAELSPSCKVKSSLSASGLMALTHSPLLSSGSMPAKKTAGTRDVVHEVLQTDNSPCKRFVGDGDQDVSPSAKMSVRRCITKTYSRKKC